MKIQGAGSLALSAGRTTNSSSVIKGLIYAAAPLDICVDICIFKTVFKIDFEEKL